MNKRKRNNDAEPPATQIRNFINELRHDIQSGPDPFGSRLYCHCLTTQSKYMDDIAEFKNAYDSFKEHSQDKGFEMKEDKTEVILFKFEVTHPASFSILPRYDMDPNYIKSEVLNQICSEYYISHDRCKRNPVLRRLLLQQGGMHFLLLRDWKFLLKADGLRYITKDGEVLTCRDRMIFDPVKEGLMLCFRLSKPSPIDKHDALYIWLDTEPNTSTFKRFLRKGYLKYRDDAYNVQ